MISKHIKVDAVEFRACGATEYLDAPGLHLMDPTEPQQYDDAREAALAKGFSVVWCHYSNVVAFRKAA